MSTIELTSNGRRDTLATQGVAQAEI